MARRFKHTYLVGMIAALSALFVSRGLGHQAPGSADALADVVVSGGPQEHAGVYLTPHFRVTHTLDERAAVEVGQLLEALFARYQRTCHDAGLLTHAPAKPLQWRFFDRVEEFRSCVRQEESDLPLDEHAFYSSRSDSVALLRAFRGPPAPEQRGLLGALDVRRISHEAAHQLAYNTGLQMRGVMYPFWISEGLATSLETPRLEDGGLGRENRERCQRLVEARQHNRLCAFDDFITLTSTAGGDGRREDLYAEAWGAVCFLVNRDPAAFKRYLSLLAQRPHGQRPPGALRQEFIAAFGPVEELQPEWLRFLAGLSPVDTGSPSADRS